jgi:hypothetical protein
MDDWILLGGSEDYLENKIKIVKAISKDINRNFGLEKCKNMFKKSRIQNKIYAGSTCKNIKELDLREAYTGKYMWTPVSMCNKFQDLPRLRETVDNTECYA